jgi:hypothetical protein
VPKDPPITPARDHRSGPSRIVANPVAERFVGSIRRKLLDRILIIGQRHAMAVLCRHELHNNDHRPHRTLGQAAPLRPLPRRTTTKIGRGLAPRPVRRAHARVSAGRMRCADIRAPAGLLHEYQQVA